MSETCIFIKNNENIVNEINQLLHNHAIEFSKRLDIVSNFINHVFLGTNLETDISEILKKELNEKINNTCLSKNELFQKIFMFFCNKTLKINLDQFYTPLTIGEFICSLMKPGREAIDPACGTGDLLINYDGKVTLWDISQDVIEVCKNNFKLNNKKCITKTIDSIKEYNNSNEKYDYCCLNPPFGSSTVITDTTVLDNYELGKNKKKEEIGILFIERSLKLLKYGGTAFIILPNGYLGNSTKNTFNLRNYLLNYKIIAIIQLPSNTFSRSGTGVSTSLLIVEKQKINVSYDIYIKAIKNIGYILNKKNTPHKYKIVSGEYLLSNGKPILDNDLISCSTDLIKFMNNEYISNIDTVNTASLTSNILDIKRYLRCYLDKINIKNKYTKRINDYLIQDLDTRFKIDKLKEYIYLDIKQVNSPFYKKENVIKGCDLPGRAKIKLNKYDIIVSKLKGKISFAIILEDCDNFICSNGFVVLRTKNYEDSVMIFGNLFTEFFKLQHSSMCTGSIMESINENDLKNILIDTEIDISKYKNVLNALTVINNEL